jgi:toxin FitB
MPLYLLDTNIVLEAANPRPNPNVVAFLQRESSLCVSVIPFEELMFGLERAPLEKKGRLSIFFRGVQAEFGGKTLPITPEVARSSGRLWALAQSRGRNLTMGDALIAATAMVHGATVVTRNVRDFTDLGVDVLNPFDQRPASI